MLSWGQEWMDRWGGGGRPQSPLNRRRCGHRTQRRETRATEPKEESTSAGGSQQRGCSGRPLGRGAEMSLSFPTPRMMERAGQGGSRTWQIRVEATQLTGLLDHTGQDGPDHREHLNCRGHPRCHVPLTRRGHRSAPPTPSLARPGPAGLRELVWGERTSTGAPLGSQQAPASPVTPPTGRARTGRGGATGTPAGVERSAG